MGAIYNSAHDLLMQESEASDAYKKRKAAEQRKADKQERDRIFRKGAAIDSDAGGGRKGEKEGERRIKQVGNMNPGLKKQMKNASAGKMSEKDGMKLGSSVMRAIDAKDRHDRRHPKKESAGYGIFSSIIAEEQIDDPDLGDGVDELGMGDRDFGDNMEADTMMGESSINFY